MTNRDVVVTGIGVLLPGCDDRALFFRQLDRGESQLTLDEDPAAMVRRRPIGRIRGFEPGAYLGRFPERYYARCPRETQLYLSCVSLAWRDAALDPACERPERVGFFQGTSRGNFEFWYARAQAEARAGAGGLYDRHALVYATPGQALGIAAALWGAQGPTFTFNCSCSSGAVAIGHAFQQVARGEIDVAVAGGHESALVGPLYRMYADAGLLTAEADDASAAIRPYTAHSGNAFSEGATVLVLEDAEHAAARGVRALARIAAFRYGNTGRHPTHVDPDGTRLAEVAGAAMQDAGVSASDMALVVGHGNGVRASDLSEIGAMRKLFGPGAADVPLISVKPVYGHALGAASAVNVAAAVVMLEQGRCVRTLNADSESAELNFGRRTPLDPERTAALALSLGLGGHNCAVLIRSATHESEEGGGR